MHSPLELTLVLLAVAMIGVVLFRMLQSPPMLAYPVAGVLIGPKATGLKSDSAQTRYLAGFGVVFLIFSIGLEFSLSKLRSMRRLVLELGASQVGLTTLLTIPVSMVLSHWYPLSWQTGLALGGVLATSSTATVSKTLAEHLQLEAKHGRNIISALLFQDLAAVLLLIVVPSLDKNPTDLVLAPSVATLKITAALVLILLLRQKLLPRWFHLMAVRHSQELFMPNLLLATPGMAVLMEQLSLSMALSTFLAGMLVSETPYRLQVEEDIKPFRGVLLDLFFMTVGMLLDPRVVLEHWTLVLGLVMAPALFKFVLTTLLARVFGSSGDAVIRTALGLVQIGEFDFMLLSQIDDIWLIDPLLGQAVLAAILLSMLLAPFLIQYNDVIAICLSRTDQLMQSLAMTKVVAWNAATRRHIIIHGYRRSGQNLAHTMEQEGIGYVALGPDSDRIRNTTAASEHVVYGDVTRCESLVAADIHRAAVIAIIYADTALILKVLHHMQAPEPTLPVTVRTIDDANLNRL